LFVTFARFVQGTHDNSRNLFRMTKKHLDKELPPPGRESSAFVTKCSNSDQTKYGGMNGPHVTHEGGDGRLEIAGVCVRIILKPILNKPIQLAEDMYELHAIT
jgi:hypothetical protein